MGFGQSHEEYGLRLHDLRDLTRAGLFPIVGIDLTAYKLIGQHAQVVVDVSSRGVVIQDPLLGQFVSQLFVFEQAWQGSDFLTIIVE